MNDDEWLTTETAARRLGVSRTTVYHLCQDHRLACQMYRVNTRTTIRIRAADLEAFLERWRDPDAAADDIDDWR